MADASTGDGSRPMLPRRELTTPRSAAIAGILFAVLLGTSLVLLRVSVPIRQEDAGEWLSDPDRRRIVRWALNLVPFAGIAFLCSSGWSATASGPSRTVSSRPRGSGVALDQTAKRNLPGLHGARS